MKILIGIIVICFVILPCIGFIIGAIAGLLKRAYDRIRMTRDWKFTDADGNTWTVKGKPLFKRG